MKNLFLLLFISLTISVASQTITDTASYTNSVRLNIAGLPFRSITCFADHKIGKANYLEFTAGYRFPWNTDNSKILFIPVEDPFWFFSKINAGIGFNHFFGKHFSLGPYLQYQYKYFDKIRFYDYVDYNGDIYDEDWIISRHKNEAGLYFKLGYSHAFGKMFIYNLYFDMGLNCAYTVEKVWAREGWPHSPIPGDYPITTSKFNYPLGINIGFTLGFYK